MMPAVPIASSTGLPARVAVPLAYAGWWVTGVILWAAERQDHAVRFHAAQSMAAFGIIAFAIAGFATLAVVSLSFLPAAFELFVWAAALTWAGGLILWAVVMWQAASGRAPRLPLAADLARRIAPPTA